MKKTFFSFFLMGVVFSPLEIFAFEFTPKIDINVTEINNIEEEPCDCGTMTQGECAPCPPEDDGYPLIRQDLDTPIDLETTQN